MTRFPNEFRANIKFKKHFVTHLENELTHLENESKIHLLKTFEDTHYIVFKKLKTAHNSFE